MTNYKDKRIIVYVLGGVLVLLIAFTAGVFLATNKDTFKPQGNTTITQQTTEKLTTADTTKAEETSTTPHQTESPVFNPVIIGDSSIVHIDEETWFLTLVNTERKIPEDYKPDLVAVCGSSQKLDRKIALEYEKMFAAAYNDGVVLKPYSGYRSYEVQSRNYDKKTDYYVKQGLSIEEAKAQAATVILPPGSSEHNLGYAMDIVCAEDWFEDTNEFRWLQENAADYGFILRYPKDKQHITNIIYEPWHWRYVGVEAAKEMKQNNLTLEEYLGVVR